MHKNIIILLSLLLIMGGGIYFFTSSSSSKNSSNEIIDIVTDLEPLACDMNTNSSCPVNFKGKKINFSLSPRPVFVMHPFSMWIEGLSELNLKDPSLEIYGVNMEMGVIKAKLEKRENEYKANIVLSACVVSIMRYRFEVMDEGKKTGLFIDFDIKQ